jgi:hypothetical protein
LDFPHQPGRYRRDFSGLVVEHDVFAGDERIGEINAEAARKVVVANSGRKKRILGGVPSRQPC